MPDYRIKDWKKNFENNRTRELKHMDWVPIPNRMDGDGYTELVDHPNGAAHLGAWIAIVEIASRRDERGTLPSGTGGLSRTLARISRLSIHVFDEVIPRLARIGWLEECPVAESTIPQDDAGIPQDDAPRARAVTEGNSTEEEGREQEQNAASGSGDGAAQSRLDMGTGGWEELVEVASKAQMVIDPSTESNACKKYWRYMDFRERRDAIDGILARVECGQFADPAYTPSLENYLRHKKWRESLRPRAGPRLVDKKAAASEEFDRRMEEVVNARLRKVQ